MSKHMILFYAVMDDTTRGLPLPDVGQPFYVSNDSYPFGFEVRVCSSLSIDSPDSSTLRLRENRAASLMGAYGIDEHHIDQSAPIERYAAVTGSGEYEDGSMATYKQLQEAFDHLADSVLDGLQPEAVFDLDTGERIDIHVSTPIVTRSEDQMGINPLRPEEN